MGAADDLALDEVLNLLPYFAALRPDERAHAASRMRVVSLNAGQAFALSADAPEWVVVAGGALTLERSGEKVRLFAGDSAGDAEVLAGKGPAEVMTADEPSSLAVLDRVGMDALFAELPIVARPWVAELGRELKWRNDLLRDVLLARAQGFGSAQVTQVLRRRRRKLHRTRHQPFRRMGALLWRVLFVEPARRPAFWMFAGVLLALASARAVVATILHRGLQGQLFALIHSDAGNPIHVHHFNYGLAIVSLVGLVSMLPRVRRMLRLLSFAFGFGMGLVVDEFSLLWNLNPDYYQPGSWLAIAGVVLGLMQVVYFRSVYVALARRLFAWVTT
jgi:hypothetical protein